MAKITLTPIASLEDQSTAISALNTNFSKIATAIENTLSRDGTSPNTMTANLDINNYRIVHLPLPTAASEPARLTDIDSALVDYQLIRDDAEQYSGVAEAAATQAATSASNAGTSATNASASASAAASSASSASTSASSAASSLASINAAAAGVRMTFSSSTTNSDPGTGTFRFNNATYSSVTSVYIDNTDKNGSTITTFLDTFDDSTTTGNRGTLYFIGLTTSTHFAIFKLTAIADSTGYRTATVSHIQSNGTFSGDYAMFFVPTGDKGSSGAGSGDLVSTNNLSDVANASTARTNLGLAIGSNVQAYDATLSGLASVTTAADKIIYATASDVFAATDFTSTARSLLDDTSVGAMRTTLGLATVAATGLYADLLSKPTTISGFGLTDAETLGKVAGINTQTASYVLVLTDVGKVIEQNSASSTTVTIPPNSSVAFPIGTRLDVVRYGAGAVALVAGSGVTIRAVGLNITTQYCGCSVYKRSTDEWVAVGTLS